MDVDGFKDLPDKEILIGNTAGKICAISARIEDSDSKEEIVMLVDSMDFLDSKVCSFYGAPSSDIKSRIKIGKGSFKRIQQKCIQMDAV